MLIRDLTKRTGTFLKRNGPEIMLGAGMILTAAGAVIGAIAAYKSAQIKQEEKEEIIKSRDEIVTLYADNEPYMELNEQNDQKEKEIKREANKKIIKKFIVPVALYAAGNAFIIGSHITIKKRLAATSASLASVIAAYSAYRNEVRKKNEELAESIDFKDSKKVDEETGEIIDTKKPVENQDFTRAIFSAKTSKIFDECSATSNIDFLENRMTYFKELLRIRKSVFLNEIFDELGMDRTEEGQYLGWIYDPCDPKCDNFIDFGPYFQKAKDGEDILLVFNLDGNILEKNALKRCKEMRRLTENN